MVQVLFDQGALVRNGAVKLTRPLASIEIRGLFKAFWPRESIG